MVLYKWFLTVMKTVVESSSSKGKKKKKEEEKWAGSIWSNPWHVGKTNQKVIKLFIMCSLEGSCSQVAKWPWDEHHFFHFQCCTQRDLKNPKAEITTAWKRNAGSGTCERRAHLWFCPSPLEYESAWHLITYLGYICSHSFTLRAQISGLSGAQKMPVIWCTLVLYLPLPV